MELIRKFKSETFTDFHAGKECQENSNEIHPKYRKMHKIRQIKNRFQVRLILQLSKLVIVVKNDLSEQIGFSVLILQENLQVQRSNSQDTYNQLI